MKMSEEKREKLERTVKESHKFYEEIEIPEELNIRVQTALSGKKGETMRKRTPHYRRMTVAATIFLCFTAALNYSETFAASAAEIPVIGTISRVLTFRSYEKKDEDKEIHVELPQIADTDLEAAPKQMIEDINREIEEIMGAYEAEYKKAFLDTGGTEAEFAEKNIKVDASYEIKYENDKILSFVITANENWCGAYDVQYAYNLDMINGKNLTLKDMLGENYIETVNKGIRKQMEERMKADSNLTYWDGSNGITGFQGVDENTKFYIGKNGNPVIVFDKYEIAPGAFGRQEFEIQR